MRNKLVVIIFAIILLTVGCSEKTNEEILYKAQKQILSLESYICTANITVHGNKSPEQYTVKQWFKAPDKYRIEIVDPENLKGKVTIYNGKRAWIRHPRIGQEWLTENFSASIEQKMFLGYFINNFVNTENVKLSREIIENNEYVLLQTEIPGNHPYFNKERLWFDSEKYYPYNLQVLDTDDNVRIDVKYLDFSYNENINDNIFTIR